MVTLRAVEKVCPAFITETYLYCPIRTEDFLYSSTLWPCTYHIITRPNSKEQPMGWLGLGPRLTVHQWSGRQVIPRRSPYPIDSKNVNTFLPAQLVVLSTMQTHLGILLQPQVMHDGAMAMSWIATAVFANKFVHRLAQFLLREVRRMGGGVAGFWTH